MNDWVNGRRAQSGGGGGRGGSRSDLQLALHCTATEERWKVQVHTILYHNDNNTRLAQSWMVPSSDGGRVNWKVVSRGAYIWKRTQKGEGKNLVK